MNVTALPWPPYWDEVEDKAPDGSVVKRYSGSDYLALVAISEALNFTVNVVPTASWAEVTNLNVYARILRARSCHVSDLLRMSDKAAWVVPESLESLSCRLSFSGV